MITLYRDRNWFASGPAFLLFVAAIALTAQHSIKPPKPKQETPMRVTIAQPPQAEPLPPMPEMPAITPPTPDIALPAMEKFTPRPKAAPTPKPTPSPSAEPTPQAQPQEEASSAPAAVAPATAARAMSAPAASASEDDAYSAQVRTYLDSIKHYPTSKEARLQHPRGVVEVWFVLDRSGGIKEAGVETSSGSLILDGAALSLVRSASYPAFQPDAFKGQTTHRFTVHLNYTLT